MSRLLTTHPRLTTHSLFSYQAFFMYGMAWYHHTTPSSLHLSYAAPISIILYHS